MSAVLVASTAAVPVGAHPPNSTDHGVPEETFHKLWSGDQDGANLSNGSAVEQLGEGTDVPFDSPPRAVERWNRGDHQEFPATNSSVSIHPPDADLTSDQFIKEAYTEVFAVQPSTRARLSSSGRAAWRGDRCPVRFAPAGSRAMEPGRPPRVPGDQQIRVDPSTRCGPHQRPVH